MERFKIPVRKEVPAYAEVEMEANSLEEACLQVQEDIHKLGVNSDAAEAEFTADWGGGIWLKVGRCHAPRWKNFSSEVVMSIFEGV